MFFFFEPHDGVRGALKALPKAVKNVIDAMDGEHMSLAAALCLIDRAKPEGTRLKSVLSDDRKQGSILLTEGDMQNLPMHAWKLISFSEESRDHKIDSQ